MKHLAWGKENKGSVSTETNPAPTPASGNQAPGTSSTAAHRSARDASQTKFANEGFLSEANLSMVNKRQQTCNLGATTKPCLTQMCPSQSFCDRDWKAPGWLISACRLHLLKEHCFYFLTLFPLSPTPGPKHNSRGVSVNPRRVPDPESGSCSSQPSSIMKLAWAGPCSRISLCVLIYSM